ncbi:hypothetical protein FKM82_028078 [Ascaphus truei]
MLSYTFSSFFKQLKETIGLAKYIHAHELCSEHRHDKQLKQILRQNLDLRNMIYDSKLLLHLNCNLERKCLAITLQNSLSFC